ncbi:tetratricopeptide repeat protein 28-like isoform X2 [Watersipora subatra]|uniref:tetratricopeptide repeat protein 28-like isoform X2 n=1 Tax=Watersipora subatra TaxID=2589382 RepID=UPI00355B5310
MLQHQDEMAVLELDMTHAKKWSSLTGLEFDPDTDELFAVDEQFEANPSPLASLNNEVRPDHFISAFSDGLVNHASTAGAYSGHTISGLLQATIGSEDANNAHPMESSQSRPIQEILPSSTNKPLRLSSQSRPSPSSPAAAQGRLLTQTAVQHPVSEQRPDNVHRQAAGQKQQLPPQKTTPKESPAVAPRRTHSTNNSATGRALGSSLNSQRQPPKPAPRKTKMHTRPMSPQVAAINEPTTPQHGHRATATQVSAARLDFPLMDIPDQNVVGAGNNPGAECQREQATDMIDVNEETAMDRSRFYLQNAKLKLQKNEYTDSVEFFKKALKYLIIAHGENHVDVAEARATIGRVYAKQDFDKEALEEMLKALKIYESHGYSASKGAEELWKLHDAIAQAYGSLSKEEESAKHYVIAIQILTESDPTPPERLQHMRNNLGNAYKEVGQLDKARTVLELAKEEMLKIHPEPSEEMAKVHSSLGDVYSELKLNELAINELSTCIRIKEALDPGLDGEIERSGTHRHLARLFENIGNMVKAREHISKADLDLNTILNDKAKRKSLMEAIAAKGKDSSNSVGKYIVKLMADDMKKANDYQKEGDHRNAIIYYEKVINFINQQSAEARESEQILRTLAKCYNNVGNAYRKVDKFDKAQDFPEAEKNFLEAIRISEKLAASHNSPTLQNHLAASHNNLGVMYQTWEKYPKSVEHLKESIRLRGLLRDSDKQAAFDLPSGYHNLANTYMLMDYILEAKEFYEKELEIRRSQGSDTTGVRVSLSRIYDKLGDVDKAEALLDDL